MNSSSPAGTRTPLISPAPDTPSANLHSSSPNNSPSNGQMSCPRTMSDTSPPPATSNESFALHELKEALQHSQSQQRPAPPPSQAANANNRSAKAISTSSSSSSLPIPNSTPRSQRSSSPVWVPRQSSEYWANNTTSLSTGRRASSSHGVDKTNVNDDDDEKETDQLLRESHRSDDQGFFDDKADVNMETTANATSSATTASNNHANCLSPRRSHHHHHASPATSPASISSSLHSIPSTTSSTQSSPQQQDESRRSEPKDLKYRDTGSVPQQTQQPQPSSAAKKKDETSAPAKKKGRSKEVMVHEPAVLIEGVLFRANYLGSTQIVCEGQPTKYTRMMQAEEAVSRIKAPEGETQPSTEVDLFISTEKIMVLNTELKEIMMDHALRTISYIADIGDLVVLMARRRMISQDGDDSAPKIAKTPKMVCHVFESEEAQFIAQSIGQAFQVAYMEFLKANGIEDQSFVREMDYQEVLNSQEIFGDELQMFAKKELQKEVIVPKARNEILGVVIVESGWGSMLPTVVIANLAPAGAAARCGQLNIGDQIIAINGISLVGLPLSTCQTYIKNTKSATVVKLTVVPCPPVVEVKIKRPDTKYQLGFSVQNGVICSLLRGGIAERGGVRVGHRIIEINGQSVVAVPHERIVGLLATSVGEINMKTMPTSMFRLLIGQETPIYI